MIIVFLNTQNNVHIHTYTQYVYTIYTIILYNYTIATVCVAYIRKTV